MTNTIGNRIRLTSFGESHGSAIGGILDGVPSRIKILQDLIQKALNRRKPGQSDLSSPRKEPDFIQILSGLDPEGYTLGSPIGFIIQNENIKKQDYLGLNQVFRPSHADYTHWIKYGITPQSGGGRASARETAVRVAAGAICEQVLNHHLSAYRTVAWVQSVHTVESFLAPNPSLTKEMVDQHPTRCPDLGCQDEMKKRILEAKDQQDSVGGVLSCLIQGVPPGMGNPIFGKLQADLARAMLSIPAARGFSFGSGFMGTKLFGSEHNDAYDRHPSGRVCTQTNHSGGIQGGISNGEPIFFQVAMKPVATIGQPQRSVTINYDPCTLLGIKGRHDPCVLPRAVPVVEAMVHLVLCDHYFS